MVESTHKSKGVTKAHTTMHELLAKSKNLSLNDLDHQDLSRAVTKMPDRTDPVVCRQTLDVLFEAATLQVEDEASKEVIANLRSLVGEVGGDLLRPKPRYMDAFFFPNKQNVKRISQYIAKAKKNLIICIFTLTNDDLCKSVLERWNAGVNVRIISDDECSVAKGSDIKKLADLGIPVRTDDAPTYHMHDKFMVVDDKFVMTGSFNWTYSAGSHNQENLAIMDHPYYIEKYTKEFEKLWIDFDKNEINRKENQAAVKIQKQYRSTQPARDAKKPKTNSAAKKSA